MLLPCLTWLQMRRCATRGLAVCSCPDSFCWISLRWLGWGSEWEESDGCRGTLTLTRCACNSRSKPLYLGWLGHLNGSRGFKIPRAIFDFKMQPNGYVAAEYRNLGSLPNSTVPHSRPLPDSLVRRFPSGRLGESWGNRCPQLWFSTVNWGPPAPACPRHRGLGCPKRRAAPASSS